MMAPKQRGVEPDGGKHRLNTTLDDPIARRPPIVWSLALPAGAAAGYIAGILSAEDMGLILAITSFGIATFLSLLIETRRKHDTAAIGGFLAFTVGFTFVSAPAYFPPKPFYTNLTRPTQALGVLAFGFCLGLMWYLFTELSTRLRSHED